jgi:hypothetical protein
MAPLVTSQNSSQTSRSRRPVVAHQHHRALELVEGDAQRLARRQVEVVGRLVEEQQVGPLPDQHRQHQPRLLAARERADRLRHHLADEAERAEEVAQLLLARGRAEVAGEPHHVHQRPSAGESTSSSCCAK